MSNTALVRIEALVEDLREALQNANAPGELMHAVGLLNGLVRIYERTDEAGIDFTNPDEPLVALPKQVQFLEGKLNQLFSRIGTTKVRFSTENP